MITGINHITLAVSNLERSLQFYCGLMGCRQTHAWPGGAYLEAGDLWLCLTVCDAVDPRNDYTHIAFNTDQNGFAKLAGQFNKNKVRLWQQNSSEGDSIYFLDPDGHKLELHVGSLASRMSHLRESGRVGE